LYPWRKAFWLSVLSLLLFDPGPSVGHARGSRPELQTDALVSSAGEKRMSEETNIAQLDQERLAFAREVVRQYGDKIPANIQQDILAQRVSIGMPPYEASLAAGEYTFEVKADPKWPENVDPQVVIQAQSMHPDHSRIWLTFRNGTQFPDKRVTRFKVYFEDGRAKEITPLDNPP
jgi:hypothetical protein